MDTSHATETLDIQERRWKNAALQFALAIGVIIWASWETGLLDGNRLAEGVPDFIDLGGEMIPPDFTHWKSWLSPLFDTLAMSIAGTALAVIFSCGLAFFSAQNTSPHPLIYQLSRVLLNLFRAIPELIMGIIFVAAVGFGSLPGVLALGIHSIGMVGKFFGEAIEHVDEKPVEAVRSTGATPLQVLWHGYLPQVLPQMADVIVYRWEYNFRASTILGAVGAGGIGFELIASLRIMKYQEVLALILVILLMVTVVDFIGSRLRRQFK